MKKNWEIFKIYEKIDMYLHYDYQNILVTVIICNVLELLWTNLVRVYKNSFSVLQFGEKNVVNVTKLKNLMPCISQE